MNTKEKIEYLKRVLELEKKTHKYLDFSEVEEVILSITDSLKRGEKFKAMWEELKKKYGSEFIRDWDILKCLMYPIKQKYFPKPVKKYITIEVESEKEEEVDAGMEDIKELVDNMGCPKMKIANKWREE